MAKIGYKLGYNCNFPLSKRKRKNEIFFFFLRKKHTNNREGNLVTINGYNSN